MVTINQVIQVRLNKSKLNVFLALICKLFLVQETLEFGVFHLITRLMKSQWFCVHITTKTDQFKFGVNSTLPLLILTFQQTMLEEILKLATSHLLKNLVNLYILGKARWKKETFKKWLEEQCG